MACSTIPRSSRPVVRHAERARERAARRLSAPHNGRPWPATTLRWAEHEPFWVPQHLVRHAQHRPRPPAAALGPLGPGPRNPRPPHRPRPIPRARPLHRPSRVARTARRHGLARRVVPPRQDRPRQTRLGQGPRVGQRCRRRRRRRLGGARRHQGAGVRQGQDGQDSGQRQRGGSRCVVLSLSSLLTTSAGADAACSSSRRAVLSWPP